MELDPDIAAHYLQGVERNRLTTWGRLEAERTRALLARFLPPPPAVVLDVGGAEGAYALPLAHQGYLVHLIDPLPAHVETARAASAAQPGSALASAEIGDADVEGHPEWFTLAFLHTPDGLRDEVRSAGFPDADVYAVEGLGAGADLDAALDDPIRRRTVLKAIARVEREPSLLGASPHLMAIATRP